MEKVILLMLKEKNNEFQSFGWFSALTFLKMDIFLCFEL